MKSLNNVVFNVILLCYLIAFSKLFAKPLPFWPIRGHFKIGAHFQDYQDYGGVSYFHGGIDIRAPAGTDVFAPISGIVQVTRYSISAANSPPKFEYTRILLNKPASEDKNADKDWAKYVEVAIIDDSGQTWMFRHLSYQSIPPEIFQSARRKEKIKAGQLIGKIFPWPISVVGENDKYDHVHLEIINKDGYYINPVLVLPPILDSVPPKIEEVWFVPNEEETCFSEKYGITTVSGAIDIIVKTFDKINNSNYKLVPYRIGWEIRDKENKYILAKKEAFIFDRLPFKGDRTQLANVIYKRRIKTSKGKIESNGNAEQRNFLLVLTNGDFQEGYSAIKALNTNHYKNDLYIVKVQVYDISGNYDSIEKKIQISN